MLIIYSCFFCFSAPINLHSVIQIHHYLDNKWRYTNKTGGILAKIIAVFTTHEARTQSYASGCYQVVTSVTGLPQSSLYFLAFLELSSCSFRVDASMSGHRMHRKVSASKWLTSPKDKQWWSMHSLTTPSWILPYCNSVYFWSLEGVERTLYGTNTADEKGMLICII